MNNFIPKLLSLFTTNSTLVVAEETYEEVILIAETENANCPSYSNLTELINIRDEFHITFKSKSERLITYVQNGTKSYEDFCNEVLEFKDLFKIEIGISKPLKDSVISIYSLEKFIISLKERQTFKGIMYIFDSLFYKNNQIRFELQYDDSIIKTNSVNFLPIGILPDFPNLGNLRKIRSDQALNICHWNKQHFFIPDDFHLIETNTPFSDLLILFNRFEQLFSLIYLADITEIDENIGFKINGYKVIANVINFWEMDYASYNTYFKIYDWVYSEGNLIDKIGLARNIISLHFDNKNLSIPDSTFNSIQSSFKIYQKENIKQYIELRNKISDQLFQFKNKADSIVETYANDFKKSLFAFISFFASILVIRVVSNNNFTGTFTKETTLLSFVFLIVTFLIFLASKWELKKQKERYKESYANLKSRQKDLLNDDDVELILNGDKDFNDNISFIEKKALVYSAIWIFSIVTLAIIIIILHNLNQ
jgi:hypothetical protein